MEGEVSGSCSAGSVRFMNAFPTNKVKNQIRTEEKIGKVFTTAVDFVATSSAIFLDKIVQESIKVARNDPGNEISKALMDKAASAVKNEVEKTDEKTVEHDSKGLSSTDNDSSKDIQHSVQYILLTKESIQKAIESNQAYDFLQASIPDNMDGMTIPKYGSILRSKSRAKKRNSGTTLSSGLTKMAKTHKDKKMTNENDEMFFPTASSSVDTKAGGKKVTKNEIETLGAGLELERLQAADEYCDEIIVDDEEYD